ncbi:MULTISPECIES: hypothetical protein [Pseudoalteromonas]|uniref:hypothetical protein n=1 Tax=Pseudoalteromonas TaxID=53246 RepID=UPI0007E4F1BC|nr:MULTISPECIES: hypothetical protein [Pseudoalteromonas]MBE0377416.1 hypothetical protein [Pseudoalteromonas prydzensis ACAM 620]WKD22619.1 hypothetical protein NDQ71_13315 [Pseudoalteromonas sp. KG3]
MSNAIHRIISNAMLFALLLSVSLTSVAHDGNNSKELASPTPHYFACDTAEQTNPDFDLDTQVDGISIRVLQPLPENTSSLYVSATLTQPFSQAYQRGPPSYLV